jgi:hypothetical protein
VVETIGIFAGFVLGIAASWLFWRWQLIIKPKFAVSTKIVVRPSRNDPSIPFFQIKVVNLSSRPIINMRAQFGVHELNNSPGGPRRLTIHSISLKPSGETIIGPYVRPIDPWSITDAHYYTSFPDSSVRKLLEQKPERRLVLTIQATDAESTTTVLKRFTYTANDLVEGQFESGGGLNIISLDTKCDTDIATVQL